MPVSTDYPTDSIPSTVFTQTSMVLHINHPFFLYFFSYTKTTPGHCQSRHRIYALYPFSQITLTTSSTYFWQVSWSGASTITRTRGSVPDSRTRMRPVSPSASATALTASCTAGSFCARPFCRSRGRSPEPADRSSKTQPACSWASSLPA